MTLAEKVWRAALEAVRTARAPEEKSRARENERAAFSAYLRDNAERLAELTKQERAEQ